MQAAAEVIVSHPALLAAGHGGVVEDALSLLQRELIAAPSLRELRWLAGAVPLRAGLHGLRVEHPRFSRAAGEVALALEVVLPRESLPLRRTRALVEGARRAAGSYLWAPAAAVVVNLLGAAALLASAALWACGYSALPQPFHGWFVDGFLSARPVTHLASAGVAALFASWVLFHWVGDAFHARRLPHAVVRPTGLAGTGARLVVGVGALVGAVALLLASGVGGGFDAAVWQFAVLALWLAPLLTASLAAIALFTLLGRAVERVSWHLSRYLDRGWSRSTAGWPRWEGVPVTTPPWLALERVERALERAVRAEEDRQDERARRVRDMDALVSRLRSEMEVDEPARDDASSGDDPAGAVSASEALLGLLRDRHGGFAFRADFLLAMAHRAAGKASDEEALAVARGALRTLDLSGVPVMVGERNTFARLASEHHGGFARLQLIAATPVFTADAPAVEAVVPEPVAARPVVVAPPVVAPPVVRVRVSHEPVRESVPIWDAREFQPPSVFRSRKGFA